MSFILVKGENTAKKYMNKSGDSQSKKKSFGFWTKRSVLVLGLAPS